MTEYDKLPDKDEFHKPCNLCGGDGTRISSIYGYPTETTTCPKCLGLGYIDPTNPNEIMNQICR